MTFAFHAGEAALQAVVFKGELFVIEPEEMEDGGAEIVEWVDVFDGLSSKIISLDMAHSGFAPRTGEPAGESIWIVVPAQCALLEKKASSQTQCTTQPAYPVTSRVL